MWWIPMAVGAGLGMIRNNRERYQQEQMKPYMASQMRYSPYMTHAGLQTAQQGRMGPGASMGESVVGGAMTGLQMNKMMKDLGVYGDSTSDVDPTLVERDTPGGKYVGPADAPTRQVSPYSSFFMR